MEHFCKELLPRIRVDYTNKEVQDIVNAVDIFMKRIVKEIEKTNPGIMEFIMELFCKELLPRIRVDYTNKEVQDIVNAVDIFMKRIVKEIGKTNPDIKIKDVVLCGSNAEKTRVWGRSDEIEFDYLAVMKTWPGVESFRFEQCGDGQMNVQYLVNMEDNQSGRKQYTSLSQGVTEVFRRIAKKCVSEKCQQNLCPQFANDRDTFLPPPDGPLNCCKSCSVSMSTGTLKLDVTETSDKMHGPYKMHFMWKSKYRSIKMVNVDAIKGQLIGVKHGFDFITLNHRFPLSESYHLEIMNNEIFSVPVDFHPVIEIGQSAEVHQEFQIFLRQSYLVLPSSYGCAIQTVERNRLRNSKEMKLANFIFSLIFKYRYGTPIVKVMPVLDRSINYFLFPKSHFDHTDHGCWRISSCVQERDILSQTSEEHRSAYCLLKFLTQILFMRFLDITFHNYEIKISVINHIKHCKTPTVGAHVCLLGIMHEISLCRSKRIMEHPFLHLNLYEMIGYFSVDRYKLNRFKILILLLANERDMYTLKDLYCDIFSINSIYYWYQSLEFPTQSIPSLYFKSIFFKITKSELSKEFKELIRNRKRNSSKYVMSHLIMDLIRKKQRLVIQNTILNDIMDNHNVL